MAKMARGEERLEPFVRDLPPAATKRRMEQSIYRVLEKKPTARFVLEMTDDGVRVRRVA